MSEVLPSDSSAPAAKPGVNYVGVGVGAIITDPQTRTVLMHLRGGEARSERWHWDFPGGTVEWSATDYRARTILDHPKGSPFYGDLLKATVARECLEEHGVNIEIVRELGSYQHYIPNEGQFWISHTYLARIIGDISAVRIMEPDKCAEIAWMNRAQLRELLEANQLAGVSTQIVADLLAHPERLPEIA